MTPRSCAARPRAGRRIIDVTKEALVIMAEALEEIGDAYAIYGFSGHGRQNVEFYLVKSFNEALVVGGAAAASARSSRSAARAWARRCATRWRRWRASPRARGTSSC